MAKKESEQGTVPGTVPRDGIPVVTTDMNVSGGDQGSALRGGSVGVTSTTLVTANPSSSSANPSSSSSSSHVAPPSLTSGDGQKRKAEEAGDEERIRDKTTSKCRTTGSSRLIVLLMKIYHSHE